MKNIILLLLSTLFISWTISAQQISYPTDVIASKLGYATTAFTDTYTASGNPATLASLSRFNFRGSVRNRFSTAGLYDYGITANFGLGKGNLGLNTEHFGFEAFRQQQLVVAYGMQLTEKWSVGINFRTLFIQQENQASNSSLNGSFGLLYQWNNQLSLGIRLMPLESSELDGLTNSFRHQSCGLSYKPSELVTVNLDIRYFSNALEKVSGSVGLRYQIIPQIDLGLGYRSNPNAFSFGMTWRVNEQIRIHLASSTHQTLGLSPMGGFSYSGA